MKITVGKDEFEQAEEHQQLLSRGDKEKTKWEKTIEKLNIHNRKYS